MAAVGRQSNDPIRTVSTAVNTSRTQEWHHVEINKTRDHPFFMNPMLFQPVIFFFEIENTCNDFPFSLSFHSRILYCRGSFSHGRLESTATDSNSTSLQESIQIFKIFYVN